MSTKYLQLTEAPLKGEAVGAYIYRTGLSAVLFGYSRISDYRNLIKELNAQCGCSIVCHASQSGSIALERHIAKHGGMMLRKLDDAMSAVQQAVSDVQQPAPAVQPTAQPQPVQQPVVQPTSAAPMAAEALMAALMQLFPQQQGVDAAAVETIVANYIQREGLYKAIQLYYPSQSSPSATIDGPIHQNFTELLKYVSIRRSVMLVGPAGTGKTTAALKVGEALGLKVYFGQCGLSSVKTDFLGFVDAGGKVVETEFRRAFVQGGIFLLDEADAANSNVGLALNSAIENRVCAFPDGTLTAHPDFVVIACANTNGQGATALYGGRARMDKAFADRFAFQPWPIDEKFEMALCGNPEWCRKVQAIRAAVSALGLDSEIVVSPRVSIHGAKALNAGLSEEQVLEAYCYRMAVSDDVKKQIKSRI